MVIPSFGKSNLNAFWIMKITCFIDALLGGGAEHQMSILAGFLSEKGFDVELVTYNGNNDFYKLNPQVKRIDLGLYGMGKFRKLLKLWLFFHNYESDCIISYREQINFMLLLCVLFKKVPVIVSERNITINTPSIYGIINMYLLYFRAKYVVSNTYWQCK